MIVDDRPRPRAPYFWQENAKAILRLNGESIDIDWFKKCKDALDIWIKKATPDYVEKINKRISALNEKEREKYQRENGEKDRSGFVYIIRSQGLFKIGRTKDITNRMKGYSAENPFYSTVFMQRVLDAVQVEKEMLQVFPHRRKKGRKEWFYFTDAELREVIEIARRF